MLKRKRIRKVIGRRELVDFPDLNLFEIEAKVDTGAYTSSIHCNDIKLQKKEGKNYVQFRLLDEEHPAYNHKQFTLPITNKKVVKSSFGDSEKRYIIKTKISIFGEEFKIELSLADRSKMEYPVLLGRKFLKNGFLVDVNRYHLAAKKKEAEK